jgi:hypothetical protein
VHPSNNLSAIKNVRMIFSELTFQLNIHEVQPNTNRENNLLQLRDQITTSIIHSYMLYGPYG